MASESCCSQAKNEQLYMLELLVDRLNLYPEKIQEIGSIPLTVKLEFLDFPAFEINEEEFWSTKKRNDKQTTLSSERKRNDGKLDFSAGKSCLFPKRPNELVDAMRSRSLKIGVYKTIVKSPCSAVIEDNPICKTDVPLSGCLCDQVTMSMNDSKHLPKPYTLRNTWNLIDDAGKPSGTILLLLRLTCLGKSIVTQFAVKNESFLFKGSNSSNEFQCSRVPKNDEETLKSTDENLNKCQPEVKSSAKPRRVIGLGPICQELAKRDGGPLDVVPPLKLSTNRCIEEKVTEKQDVTPKTIDDDEECVCRPGGTFLRRITREYPCGRGNCSGGLCTGPRKEISLSGNGQTASTKPCYSGSCCSGRESPYRYKSRMRGGGRWNDEATCAIGPKGDNLPSNYGEKKNPRVQSIDNLITGACKSTTKKPGCGCFGKTGTGAMGLKLSTARNNFSCGNEPCQGIDCLIRAFKETEDFVESIGKVPGLAGLGLMDPTESPFFGRDREDLPTSCDPRIPLSTTKPSSHHPRGLIRGSSGKTSSILPSAGMTSGPHRDHHVHQLDAISLISGKPKKKIEEKSDKLKDSHEGHPHHQTTVVTEPSPCGEPVCKSKRKKLPDEVSVESSIQETKKNAAPVKTTNSRRRQHNKVKSFSIPGPAGDRLSSHRNSYIRVSKRVMNLVNAMRDPRYCHGHKYCLDVRLRVPGNMGWLWNTNESPGRLRTPIGWKPGAISKFVWERLQQAKSLSAETGSSSEIRPTSASSKGKRTRSFRSKSFHSLGRSQWAKNRMHDNDDDEIELPPTLHIHRKDGTYYVTMYPVKGEDKTESEEQTKPLQFKITKNKDDEMASSSSTGSDMEIEFSPPAAINRYRKKEPVDDKNTQVYQQEILDTFKVTTAKPQSKAKKAKNKK